MKHISKIFGSVLLASALLTGCSSGSKVTSTSTVEVTDNATKEVVAVNLNTTNTYSSLAEMIASVKSSVVDVYSYISSSSYSAGSGVIIGTSENGYYIVTNHHVIDEATSFDVVVYTGDTSKTYEAHLIGGSPKSDIAILKIETEDTLTVATFIEDSNTVQVGTSVVAIGNPLGILGGTVTQGIISATAREVYVSDIGYMKLFQTDAAINSGNSGGALFNSDGLLVGIVNSGYTSYEGLNFAIPANDARNALTSLINTYHTDGSNYGYVVGESDVGITVGSSTVYTDSNCTKQVNVCYAQSVDQNSDASKANILSYSSFYSGTSKYFYAINSVNGTEVSDSDTCQGLINKAVVGETLTLNVSKINYGRTSYGFMGGATYFYIDGDSFDITIDVSQYIYSI